MKLMNSIWRFKKNFPVSKFKQNYFAFGSLLFAALLSVWPMRTLIVNGMFWHMDFQMPLLILAGASFKIDYALPEMLDKVNLFGLTSFFATQTILAYWMLPLSVDKAIIDWRYDVVKIVSLVICGYLIKVSFKRTTTVIEIFFLGFFISMTIVVGYFYMTSPTRLCNVYTLDSQILAGQGLIVIAVFLSITWALIRILSK